MNRLALLAACAALLVLSFSSKIRATPLTVAERQTDCFGRCGVLCVDRALTGDFYTPECEEHDACVRSHLARGMSQLDAHLHCRDEARRATSSWLKAEARSLQVLASQLARSGKI